MSTLLTFLICVPVFLFLIVLGFVAGFITATDDLYNGKWE